MPTLRAASVEAGVRAASAIVVMPLGDQFAGMAERVECCLVEALVPELPVERHSERFLDRLSGLKVVPGDAFSIRSHLEVGLG